MGTTKLVTVLIMDKEDLATLQRGLLCHHEKQQKCRHGNEWRISSSSSRSCASVHKADYQMMWEDIIHGH